MPTRIGERFTYGRDPPFFALAKKNEEEPAQLVVGVIVCLIHF